MRKLLLGSTAVAAAALFAPTGALAQGADPFRAGGPPALAHRDLEVRLGGFFRFYYSNTDQDLRNSASGTTGKSDFQEETEIHVVANGKAANGLRYGVAIEVENDPIRSATAGVSTKTSLDLDEAWGFLAGNWGQLRFGDEDTALALMLTGFVSNFGTGGLDGDFGDSIIGGNLRPSLNMPSDSGDNTKVIYMSPQFFGFDAGASFAFNQGEGPLAGCDSVQGAAIQSCDRFSSGPGGLARRRNEVTAILRWRGSFGPVGLAAHVGYQGADVVKNSTGPSADRMNMGSVGAQIVAYGFTVGGYYDFGDANGGFNPRARNVIGASDSRSLSAMVIGASYTIDAFTVGAQYAFNTSAGNIAANTGALRQRGISAGVTYRIAPGLEAIAEYTKVDRRERNVDLGNGFGNTVEANVFLAGLRMAF
jgi:predicted porin